jgi:Na+(H+)/acetate symporter ActP
VAFSLPLAWLKWFWWRMNVFGDAVGMLGGFPAAALIWFGSDAIFPKAFRSWMQRNAGLNIEGLVPRFGDLTRYPFWMGFMILFSLGWICILSVTLLTRPEAKETLHNFYDRVRPIGWWGPVAREFPLSVRRAVVLETKQNLAACAVGIIFSYTLCIAFFSLFATSFKLAALLLFPCILSGYFFFRLTMRASLFYAATPQIAVGYVSSSQDAGGDCENQ